MGSSPADRQTEDCEPQRAAAPLRDGKQAFDRNPLAAPACGGVAISEEIASTACRSVPILGQERTNDRGPPRSFRRPSGRNRPTSTLRTPRGETKPHDAPAAAPRSHLTQYRAQVSTGQCFAAGGAEAPCAAGALPESTIVSAPSFRHHGTDLLIRLGHAVACGGDPEFRQKRENSFGRCFAFIRELLRIPQVRRFVRNESNGDQAQCIIAFRSVRLPPSHAYA